MKRAKNILIGLLLPLLLVSCYDEMVNNPLGNQPPDTFLFLYPDSTISQQASRLRVSWSGDDPDGIILGYYFKWEGVDTAWSFTTGNDSTFALSIGTSDTVYNFYVSAVDYGGNGIYDQTVIQNGINYGPEPFIDQNGNGQYNEGETYYDIGLIDPSPASLQFPIKNSSPEIAWSTATMLPASSFPVMSFGWTVADLDGEGTVTKINVALNDTTNFISLPGSTRLIAIRCVDFNLPDPLTEVLLDGSETTIFNEKLPGIKLDDYNKLYIQAVDISGAVSPFLPLPQSDSTWFVKKPKGKLLIIDNYRDSQTSADFYNQTFNSIAGGALAGKYDVFDIQHNPLPYENITFLQTMKLFDYLFWYSNYEPDLELLGTVTDRYIDDGGKVMFSMTFQDSSSHYPFDLASIQNFLPVDSLGQKKSLTSLFANADVIPAAGHYVSSVKNFFYNRFRQNILSFSDASVIYNLSTHTAFRTCWL